MKGNGADFVLTVDEMKSLYASISIMEEPRVTHRKNLDGYISEAKAKNGGRYAEARIVDYHVAGDALIKGTLGQFTVIFNGTLHWHASSYWNFLGCMSFYDRWDFDGHRGKKTKRHSLAEDKSDFARRYIPGSAV